MLSIFPIKSSAHAFKYYEVDNYYANDATEACQWWGEGAERLGLSGAVEPNRFKQLLEGKLPDGQQLGLNRNGSIKHRPGYDLTFSAPKSVSILAEVGGDTRLYELHDKAVNEALSYLQENTAQTRYKVNGKVTFENTDNFTVAKFQHNISRSLDPQLHTHCVVLNITQRPNGQWRSLSSEELYHNKMLAGLIYRSTLAYELKQLGYSITKTHADGRFEIKGVPPALLEHFSKRRQQVLDAMAERGLAGAKAAETATLMTRSRKQVVDKEALKSYWQQEVEKQGFNIQSFIEQAKPLAPVSLLQQLQTAQKALQYTISQLSEREACFSHTELLRIALARGLGDVILSDIQSAIQTEQAKGELLSAQAVKPVPNRNNTYWTTREALLLEKATIKLMQDGFMAKQSIGIDKEVHAFLNVYASTSNLIMNKGQRGAAELLLTSSDRVIGIQGYAGTGKTTMLSAVRAFAEQQGYTVKGLAPSAAAANQLTENAGIESTTLSRHLTELNKALNLFEAKGKPIELDSKAIWLLDESSMASTQQIHDLLKGAEQVNARVILVGDKKQLGAVDAGKPFDQLQKAGMATAVMDIIVRQREPELLEAVYASIKGDIQAALTKLGNNIIQITHKEERLEQLAKDYLALLPQQREQALILAATKKDQATLNELVREGLSKEGQLKGTQVTHTVLINRGLTATERTLVTNYQRGDVIRFNRTYDSLGVKAGEYLKVAHIDSETNQLTLLNQKNKAIVWEPHLVAGKRQGAVEVYESETRALSAGDIIRWTRNDAKQQLVNAETAKVLRVKEYTATIQLQGKVGKRQTLELDMRSSTSQHWDHAYASTVHAAQGKTTHIVFANAESYHKNLTNQQSFYVTISRARDSAYLYVDNKEQFLNTLNKYLGEKTSALEMANKDSYTLKPSVIQQLDDNLHLATFSKYQSNSKELEIEV
jgi:conjugative relaxase-like TrwC/TraI family protein